MPREQNCLLMQPLSVDSRSASYASKLQVLRWKLLYHTQLFSALYYTAAQLSPSFLGTSLPRGYVDAVDLQCGSNSL